MGKTRNHIRSLLLSLILCFLPFLAALADVRPIIPSTVEPERVSETLSNQQPAEGPPKLAPTTTAPEEAPSPLGPEAEKIKFQLNNIILEGNKVYSDEQIKKIYQDKLGKLISVAELQRIVQSISNYYRNNGYILSRAILPPQHVENGVVKVRVLEGYIAKVNVIGQPRGAKNLLAAIGDKIIASRPLQEKDLEHYLLLANQIPGVQVKAVLEPSKQATGASDLNMVTQTRLIGDYLSYDNYGTRYIGPNQVTLGLSTFSMFRAGDSPHATYVQTTKGQELRYYDLGYSFPIGADGLNFSVGENRALTHPLFTLSELKITGEARTYYANFNYPIWLTRSETLQLNGGFNYIDSSSKTAITGANFLLYMDHIRSLNLGVNYNFADRHRGYNSLGLDVEKGFPWLGATSSENSLFTSRFGATGTFTKITGQASRLQQLYGRLSLFGIFKGQYSFSPLLASEQFGYGGSQLGRGYDPSEIIGDRGIAGSLELRFDMTPGYFLLQTIELYTFYDAGEVWNIKNFIAVPRQQSATSTGVGARFQMMRYLTGNLMWTQPLSRKVAALQQIGNGSLPRVFFSITASI